MAKRQIKVQIMPNGEINFNNAGNPDAARIERELSELALVLNGSADGYKVEQHVHSHGHGHQGHSHEVKAGQ